MPREEVTLAERTQQIFLIQFRHICGSNHPTTAWQSSTHSPQYRSAMS